MLRKLVVENFRSLARFSVEFPYAFTCLVGENNSGKSNIATALRWLLAPENAAQRGMPLIDLSRMASSSTVAIVIDLSDRFAIESSPGSSLLAGPGGLFTFARSFSFGGYADENGNVNPESEYARPGP